MVERERASGKWGARMLPQRKAQGLQPLGFTVLLCYFVRSHSCMTQPTLPSDAAEQCSGESDVVCQ